MVLTVSPPVAETGLSELRDEVRETRKVAKLLLANARRAATALAVLDERLEMFEETLTRTAEEAQHEHEHQQEEAPGYH